MLPEGIIEKGIEAGAQFGVIRPAGETHFQLWQAKDGAPSPFHPSRKMPAGLLVAPFAWSDQNPGLSLQDGPYDTGSLNNFQFHSSATPVAIADPQPVANRASYQDQFDQLQDSFAREETQKAILSRVKRIERQPGDELTKLVNALAEQYPNATVHLTHTQYGTWLGATPEVLVSMNLGIVTTMALAGTQTIQGPLEEMEWGAKEQEEQAMVADYIRPIISHFTFDATESETYSRAAGKIAHLCTDFKGFWDHHRKFGALVADLHPTPAVAGLPREAAISLINKVETHSRGLYAGFVGGQLKPGISHYYVNLRCMQVFPHHYDLYVGGGITSDSQVDSEWEETEHKAATLLSVIEKIR